MEYTSSEAAKLLRRLNEERDVLKLSERRRKVFTASLGEDPESVRPEYDYHQVQKEPDALADVDEERYHIYFVDKQLFLH